MIYRMYFDAAAPGDDGTQEHRYCEELLGYALWREHRLSYKELTLIHNPWGKPVLRDHPQIHHNLSHCSGLAACVLSDSPAGIDAERIRPMNPHAARRACSMEELDAISHAADLDRMFFIHWTLKESCVKAMGMGLSYPLRQVVFRIDGRRILCPGFPQYRFTLLDDGVCITAVCRTQPGESMIIRRDETAGGRELPSKNDVRNSGKGPLIKVDALSWPQ